MRKRGRTSTQQPRSPPPPPDDDDPSGRGKARQAEPISGDEPFAELWKKLSACGWTSRKGKGLVSWEWMRPGAAELPEQVLDLPMFQVC